MDKLKFIATQMYESLQNKTSRQVVIAIPSMTMGGTELAAIHTSHAFDSLGQSVIIVTTSKNKYTHEFQSYLPSTSNIIHFSDYGQEIGSRFDFPVVFKYFMDLLNPSIIWSFNSMVPAHCLRLLGSRDVLSLKVLFGFYEKPYSQSTLSKWLGAFDKIVLDSRLCYNRLLQDYSIEETRLIYLSYPFSSTYFPMHREFDLDKSGSKKQDVNRPLKLFFAGRLVEDPKRPREFSHFVSRLRSEGINVVCDFWGAPDYGSINSWASIGSDFDQISTVYRGPYAGIATIPLEDYDAMVLPSVTEGLPDVLVECMGNGIPVIASNTGGISELVNTDTGWLVDNHKDINSFGPVIKDIINNPSQLNQKGINAKRLIQTTKSQSQFIKSLKAQVFNATV